MMKLVAGVALAFTALGVAAAPMAAAAVEVQGFDTRAMLTDTTAFETPRTSSAPVGEVRAGDVVEAICGFSFEGRDWVKIRHVAQYGFVSATTIRDGIRGLDAECPSEVDVVYQPTFSRAMVAGETGTTVPAATCPEDYPYLVNEDLSPGRDVPPGVLVTEPGGVGVSLGKFLAFKWDRAQYNEEGRAIGYQAGSATNWEWQTNNLAIGVVCTNDLHKAYWR